MDEHELLAQLKSRIGPQSTPVRPLAPPELRALWMFIVWSALAVCTLELLGFRSDFSVLGPWRSLGFSSTEIVLCLALVFLSLRSCVPAMSWSRGTAVSLAAVALVLHLIISWATLARSDLAPPQAAELHDGLACLASIMALGLVPFVLGSVLLVRGFLVRDLTAFVLMGLASGLAAEATWRLHCPYSAWSHVLLFHSSALLLFALVGIGTAMLVRRRT